MATKVPLRPQFELNFRLSPLSKNQGGEKQDLVYQGSRFTD